MLLNLDALAVLSAEEKEEIFIQESVWKNTKDKNLLNLQIFIKWKMKNNKNDERIFNIKLLYNINIIFQ